MLVPITKEGRAVVGALAGMRAGGAARMGTWM